MMRSLISQVVRRCGKMDESAIDPSLLGRVQQGDIQAMWTIFQNLIGRLQGATVFCIIDGLPLFQPMDEEQKIMGPLMKSFRDLVKDLNNRAQTASTGVRLKLMIACPFIGTTLREEWFADEEPLVVPSGRGQMLGGINQHELFYANTDHE